MSSTSFNMGNGDRVTSHSGMTHRQNQDHIKIVYDAELKNPGLFERFKLALHCCSIYDTKRSYLYLRENSLESNDATSLCCGACPAIDYVNVSYFDQSPYKKECKPNPSPCCFLFNTDQPKLEVFTQGCLCCCVPINCGQKAVVMPFEHFPFPFCFIPNRVGWWSNLCGLCGPISGNPIITSPFSPQPKDASAFVEIAQSVMPPDSSSSRLLNAEM